jgi:hypothetical protein
MPKATCAGGGPKIRLKALMSAGSPVKGFSGGILIPFGIKIAIDYVSLFEAARIFWIASFIKEKWVLLPIVFFNFKINNFFKGSDPRFFHQAGAVKPETRFS